MSPSRARYQRNIPDKQRSSTSMCFFSTFLSNLVDRGDNTLASSGQHNYVETISGLSILDNHGQAAFASSEPCSMITIWNLENLRPSSNSSSVQKTLQGYLELRSREEDKKKGRRNANRDRFSSRADLPLISMYV